ncbi:14099_t:CDS:2, partial [Funneliformis geosporum]
NEESSWEDNIHNVESDDEIISTYIGNSERTKRRRYRRYAQAKKNAEKNESEFENDQDLIHNSQQVINSLEVQLKEKNLHKLILTAILHETTARNWPKGDYVNCHEHEDVVEYRKTFLKNMKVYQTLMLIFEGDKMETQINPDLQYDEQLHILVIHDKTTFHSNDGKSSGWAPDHEQPLQKKSKDMLLMLVILICETIGQLQLNKKQRLSEIEDKIPHETRVMMNSEKNYDSW